MKKSYITPSAKVLPIQAHLLAKNWSVNNGLNETNTLSTNNRGVLFSDEDVLSRETDDYWEDYDEE